MEVAFALTIESTKDDARFLRFKSLIQCYKIWRISSNFRIFFLIFIKFFFLLHFPKNFMNQRARNPWRGDPQGAVLLLSFISPHLKYWLEVLLLHIPWNFEKFIKYPNNRTSIHLQQPRKSWYFKIAMADYKILLSNLIWRFQICT